MNLRYYTFVIILYLTKAQTMKFKVHPDTGLTIEELVKKYGYPLEIHEVVTDDGYILTMYRIPHGPNSTQPNENPILLMHGMTGCADNFVVGGMNNSSLAYLLTDNGHDVWLGNARGTMHSRKHKFFVADEAPYWHFSWHEIGTYDVPAKIDYILEKTKKDKLAYVGHSQGGTVFLVMTSMRPKYNDKISLAALLAPAAFMKHYKFTDPFIEFIANYHKFLTEFSLDMNINELPPSVDRIRSFLLSYCSENRSNFNKCFELILKISNMEKSQFVEEMVTVLLKSVPNSASMMQFLHYTQTIVSGHFSRFDYGPSINALIYNNKTPPDYKIGTIKAPIALFYGKNDLTTYFEDENVLSKSLPNLVLNHIVEDDKFGHVSIILAKDVVKLLYMPILELLEDYKL